MSITRDQIEEWVSEVFPDTEVLVADGFENAFVGVAFQFNNPIPIFDYEKCLQTLVDDGMILSDAEEYLEFNVTGAWVGKGTPAYLFKFKPFTTNEISRISND
jgi:hypothetical protein